MTSGLVVTQFLYDGDELIAEYNGAGALLDRYVHGNGTDDPLVWYDAGVRRYLRTDHQGSIVAVTDSSSNLVAVNSYDEWGIPAAANLGRFQYTGQAWLSELGLYYYKARIYSPTLGRFLQTDPVGYEDQANLYAYAGNDPLNGIDPLGMYDCTASTSDENCDEIDSYVRGVSEARDSYKKGSKEYARLGEIVEYLGTRGDGNGVTIGSGATKSGAPAEADGNAITMDLVTINEQQTNSKLKDHVSAEAADQYDRIYGGGFLAHEIDHSINTPFEQSLRGITEHEESGFRRHELVWRNFGIRNFDRDTYGTGETWVKNRAKASIFNWCRRSMLCGSR